MAFLTQQQLVALGFKRVGKNVKLSDKASIYNAALIEIGDNSRIDDFCVLSAGAGGIAIGSNVHIAVYSSFIGAGRIDVHDFANVSSRVGIYSSNDDYSGHFMTNPTVPEQFTGVTKADVILERHVIVGSGTIVLPGITMRLGSVAGALSLIKKDCDQFGIYAGTPAKKVGIRSKRFLDLEREYRAGK
jgi:galactoside O-acetyltransferase